VDAEKVELQYSIVMDQLVQFTVMINVLVFHLAVSVVQEAATTLQIPPPLPLLILVTHLTQCHSERSEESRFS